jgi:hypothetical protein
LGGVEGETCPEIRSKELGVPPMKPVLWFFSTCMTFAFVDVAYLHKMPIEALILGLAAGATSTAMYFGGLRRLERYLGWRS